MEDQKKEYDIDSIKTRSRENSVEIIHYFQTSNKYLEEKNEKSLKKVYELELEKNKLIEEFEKNYNITLEKAKEAKENSWHFERDFNLDDFNKIENINDKISGEKFFILQRKKLIEKNNNVIEEIENRYKK